jgi:type II secretion system protein N
MVEQSRRAQLRERMLLGSFYVTFFCVTFLICGYLTFPYDRVRDLIVSRASAADRTLEIGELEPTGLSGVHLKDVELTQHPKNVDEAPSVLRVSELSVGISPWALLFGEKKAKLHARVGSGSIDASYVQSSSAQHIEAKLASLDVAALGLGSYVGLPVQGHASGDIELDLPQEVDKSNGSITLAITGLRVGDGKAKIKIPALGGSGLTLDQIDAGKLNLKVKVQDGLATIAEFRTDGRDLKLNGQGNLRLVEPLRRSRPDLSLDLTFSDVYKNKSDRTKAMFDLIGMRSEWQRSTTPDGTLRVHVGGTLQAIRGGPAR